MEENKKPDNPNAFPSEYHNPHSGVVHTDEGMTLRDYFAAKAMQALLSNRGNIEYVPTETNRRYRVVSELCTDAFDIADAMLKEREK